MMEQENNGQLNQIAEALQSIAGSMNRDPQAERYHAETHCPSCGRFVGTETRCPYCQTETQKRLSIKIFKIISVLISTLGLIMLLFYARNVQTPVVAINELGPLSNFAHVRIVGFAAQDAKINKWGTLSFNVIQFVNEKGEIETDRTKFKDCNKIEIRVNAYKKVTADIDPARLPHRFDEVDVEGQIRVQQSEASMLINAAEHLRVKASSPENRAALPQANFDRPGAMERPPFNPANFKPIAPQAVVREMIKQPVKIVGLVKEAQQVENDCVIIKLDNGTEKGFPIFIPEFSKKQIALPTAGQVLECFGNVKDYKGELEVEINNRGYAKAIQH